MELDLDKLKDNPHLLDFLIQMEDVLDSFDIYAFPNWIYGEVVAGPVIQRYWLSMTLAYPEDKKPSKRGAERLRKHDVKLSIKSDTLGDDHQTSKEHVRQKGTPNQKIWLVSVKIPRRLIDDMMQDQLVMYDDEIETNDVKDGMDSGLNSNNFY